MSYFFFRCEQDPFEILESVKASLDGAVNELEVNESYSRKQIVAVGITNQRETTIVWNKFTGNSHQRKRSAKM